MTRGPARERAASATVAKPQSGLKRQGISGGHQGNWQRQPVGLARGIAFACRRAEHREAECGTWIGPHNPSLSDGGGNRLTPMPPVKAVVIAAARIGMAESAIGAARGAPAERIVGRLVAALRLREPGRAHEKPRDCEH